MNGCKASAVRTFSSRSGIPILVSAFNSLTVFPGVDDADSSGNGCCYDSDAAPMAGSNWGYCSCMPSHLQHLAGVCLLKACLQVNLCSLSVCCESLCCILYQMHTHAVVMSRQMNGPSELEVVHVARLAYPQHATR